MPQGRRFISRPIKADMLDPADRGNEHYIEARGAQGQLVGYLRDFTGPVSPAAGCPCNPLSLTLVFEPDTSLRTLLSPQPLQKYGHAPMSEAEVAQLIAILKAPPQRLLEVEQVDDMVDITTGATQQALVDVSVSQAALSTRRLVGIVKQTQAILQGAPGDRARGRLNALIKAHHAAPATLSQALAIWLESMPHVRQTQSLRREIWRTLAHAYEQTLTTGQTPSQLALEQLTNPALLDAIDAADLAHLALRISQKPAAERFLHQATKTLSQPEAGRLPDALLAQVRGTSRLLAGNAQDALPDLQLAAKQQSLAESPQLHLYLARALNDTGDTARACGVAQSLFRHHPKLPGANQSLRICLSTDPAAQRTSAKKRHNDLARALRQEERARFLATIVNPSDAKVSPLMHLTDARGRAVTLDGADPDRLTVVIFFATWCPHCRAELPQVRQFVASLDDAARKRVRVVAIRTAKERETMPYNVFARSLSPNFEVFVDGTMSANFAAFAHAHDLSMTLPTTAILDTAGRLRATIEPGDFRDIAQELRWAVEHLNLVEQQASIDTANHTG
jgi:thiol-disulfide isomerase/thioredoxin